ILGEIKIENYSKLENSLKDINSTVKNDYDIIKVYAKGIITGYQDGSFKPENTLTRAESATVIYRLVDEGKRVIPEEKKEDILTEDKTSGTDIASVIKNYKTFEQEKIDLGYGSNFAEATSYEFVTDMSKYKITLGENRGTKWVDINGRPPLELGWGNMYLMKDKEIVEFTSDGIYKEYDITTIEYFVFPRYKKVDHVIGIMPNPLYKNK
ncbi:MAG: S-layer homology domain-containing protein, partial [Aminipila sp.]